MTDTLNGVNKLYIKKHNLLKSIANEINYIKCTKSNLETLDPMLPELRRLYKAGRDGDDAPPLFTMVKMLNAHKHTFGREYQITQSYTREGMMYALQVKNY